jgi:hypothetical protein
VSVGRTVPSLEPVDSFMHHGPVTSPTADALLTVPAINVRRVTIAPSKCRWSGCVKCSAICKPKYYKRFCFVLCVRLYSDVLNFNFIRLTEYLE